jgi:hypothetical protein
MKSGFLKIDTWFWLTNGKTYKKNRLTLVTLNENSTNNTIRNFLTGRNAECSVGYWIKF